MSGAPDISELDALAGEHALGVLSERERAAAETRMALEPEFAQAVEDWRARLAPLAADVAPVNPPQALWARILSALPANDNGRMARALRFWRASAAGLGAVAAACLVLAVFAVSRPPVLVPQPPTPMLLNASLKGEAGPPLFVAAYDPDRKALIITSLVPPGADPVHVHELWLIPADGKPRSLGFVEPGTSRRMPMAEPVAPMVAKGAVLAVSVEAPGGSTGEGPTGPVAAKGMLGEI